MANSLLSRCFLSGRLRLPSQSLHLFLFAIASSCPFEPRELEGGMDLDLFKVILVGKVCQAPMQHRLRSSKEIVLFFLATLESATIVGPAAVLTTEIGRDDLREAIWRSDLEERLSRGER